MLLAAVSGACVRTTEMRAAAAVPAAPDALACARAQAESLGYALRGGGTGTLRFTAVRPATGTRLAVVLAPADTLRIEAAEANATRRGMTEDSQRLAREVALVARSCGVLVRSAAPAP